MTVRRATPDDAAELTRLRALMYETWGTAAGEDEWQATALHVFETRLAGDDFAAFVVDGPDGLVASGVGWVEQHLPGPHNVTGRRGHIASMSTDVAVRRQGLAREVFEALLGWYAELGVTRIDLRATPMGEPLYRALGFTEPGGTALTIDTTGRPVGREWTTPVELRH